MKSKDSIKEPLNKNKAGPWSKKDKLYIAHHSESKTSDQIAKDLRRNPEAVIKYMQANNLAVASGKLSSGAKVDNNLKDTPHWNELKKQFTKEELETILYHWNNTIRQFRDDVLHTEELQIIDMIKLEVMMNRLLTKEQEIKDKIKFLAVDEESLKKISSDSRTEEDKDDLHDIERQIASLYMASGSISKEYLDNLKEKTKILDKLKATREQRIKEIQTGKETVSGWIRQLLMNPQHLARLGQDMEKMRLATNVEIERLSQYHTYINGEVDQPLLTPETVFLVDEEPQKVRRNPEE